MLVIELKRRVGWMRFSNSEIEDWAYRTFYGRHKTFCYTGFHVDHEIVTQTNEFLNFIKRRCE